MNLEYRYINRQVFPASVGYTLILEDKDEPNSDPIRIEKCFKADDGCIDEEFLRTEAKKEIKRIQEYVPEVEVVEVSPDEALSDG